MFVSTNFKGLTYNNVTTVFTENSFYLSLLYISLLRVIIASYIEGFKIPKSNSEIEKIDLAYFVRPALGTTKKGQLG